MTLLLNDSDQEKIKDPEADLDFVWDWTEWLSPLETIQGTPTFVILPATTQPLTHHSESVAGGIVTAWLAGGKRGVVYRVTCHITTNQGRIDDRSIILTVEDR